MLSKDILAVDIGTSYTKLLVGNKKKIKLHGLVKTPENSVVGENIVNLDPLADLIRNYLDENNLKPREVSFAIHGTDIFVRHIEIPVMDYRNIGQAIEWEIGQYLPAGGNNYYIDYEIIEKIKSEEKKTYKLMVVAAPIEKIENYVKLAAVLNLKLRAIDLSANCTARVFRKLSKEKSPEESMGVIDIGYKTSKIVILNKGRLFMEREIPFGINHFVFDISMELGVDEENSYAYLFNKFDFNSPRRAGEMTGSIQRNFERMIESFNKVIQFYTNGKTQKSLDKIYLIGGGCDIPGIVEYINEFLTSPVSTVKSPSSTLCGIKFPEGSDTDIFINTLGLLLRKE